MSKNPLVDVVPAKYRKYVYAVLSLLALGYSAYLASDGDWRHALGSFLVSLVGATAASNTPKVSSWPPR